MRLIPREIDKLLLHQGSFFFFFNKNYLNKKEDLLTSINKIKKLGFWHKNVWQGVSS